MRLTFPGRDSRLTFLFMFLASLGLVLFFSFYLPARHDYAAYTGQWSLIISGKDPWLFPDGSITGNAYGPLFNLFSLLYALHPDLPRALFAIVWFASGAVLFQRIDSGASGFGPRVFFLAAFLFLNPFFFLSTVYYGQFDILVAFLCLAAVLIRMRNRDTAAGIVLGLAFLFKIYPIVILPALALEKWKVRRGLLNGFAAVAAGGFGLAWLMWGDSVWAPFSFASGRDSTAFSIFHYLRGAYSPFGAVNIDWLSLPMMAIGLAALLGVHLKRGLDPLIASMLFFFMALTFFKVGHSQFYTPLFLLMALWFIEGERRAHVSPATKIIAVSPLLFISISVFMYYVSGGFSGSWARMFDLIGLPAFVLSVLSMLFILKNADKDVSLAEIPAKCHK